MAAILSAILVIVCQTKPVFELERKDDGSNSYIKGLLHGMGNLHGSLPKLGF